MTLLNRIIVLLIIFNGFCQNITAQSQLLETYNLMPWPKEINEKPTKFIIDSSLSISINPENKGRVNHVAVSFLRRLTTRTGVFLNEGFPVNRKKGSINIAFNTVAELNIKTDESYTLNVENNTVNIKANTDVGAIRALETLLQLTQFDTNNYFFPGVTINDAPRFVWRGLMIDVARHFQPIDVLKRNLDAMASVKMNVFHWHLTDDQGFRVEVKSRPELYEKASDGLYYTQEQIKDVVAYASGLGIRVVPEFDVPGHGTSWLVAYPEIGSKENTTYKIERNSGIFDPTLDPTNPKTYEVLEDVFTEMVALFPDVYFHIGGDENEGKHWDGNKKIEAFKKQHGFKTNHELQNYFNIKVLEILKKHGKVMMGWEEILQPGLPKDVVIHSWKGEESLTNAITKGYMTVLSKGYYIDLMLSVKGHYSTDPFPKNKNLTKTQLKNILGGEATMWSELVTPVTIDSRIWPRTAAIAERFWSPKKINDIDNMKRRLKDVSFKLEELGITHIRNKAAILRGLTNNQEISSLEDLSNICEPLKNYHRNEGGTEYKTYSPFTLFADACVSDAQDADVFNKAVLGYIENFNETDLSIIQKYLNKWAQNYSAFSKINSTPKTQPLEDLSKNLSEISKLLSVTLKNKKVTPSTIIQLQAYQDLLSKPFVDVEVVVVDAFNKLILNCKKNYLEP